MDEDSDTFAEFFWNYKPVLSFRCLLGNGITFLHMCLQAKCYFKHPGSAYCTVLPILVGLNLEAQCGCISFL